MPRVGIFSQRVKDRPNPIGITAVEIVAVKEDMLVVKGLDAINKTPVLDVKPYYPQYNRIDDSRIPVVSGFTRPLTPWCSLFCS